MISKLEKLTLMCVIAACCTLVAAIAHASWRGITAEASLEAGGVTVRRVYDNDLHVHCWVASGPQATGTRMEVYDNVGRTVAISCLPDHIGTP